jgi:hypothetical protein
MENSHSLQHQPSQKQAIATPVAKAKSGVVGSWNVLVYLVGHYPWLLFIVFLALCAGSATLSVWSLGYVAKEEKPKAADTMQVDVKQPITSPGEPVSTTNPISSWMVIAIAMSCAGGCLVIFRFLNISKQRQRVNTKVNRYQVRVAQRGQKLEPAQQIKKPPVFVPPQAPQIQNQAVFVPPPQIHQQKPQRPQPVVSPPPEKPQQPSITVLPPEDNYPQRKNPNSLADMLDIRKQSSLSSILDKNNK